MNRSEISKCWALHVHKSGVSCMALSVTPSVDTCIMCKFGKTRQQYDADQRRAEEILARKGLRKVIGVGDKGMIVTVAEVERRGTE